MGLADHIGITMGSDGLFGLAIQQGYGESGYSGWTDYTKMSYGYNYPVTDEVIHNAIAAGNTDSPSAYTDVAHYYSLTDLSFSPIKNINVLPPETNRRAFPTGAYLTGMWGQGVVSMIPRLDNRFGWILLAALGEVSTVSDTTIAHHLAGNNGSDSGIHSHIFSFVDTHQFFTPWLTCYRLLPCVAEQEQVGEVYQDAHFRTFTINAAAVSPITVDLDIMARLHTGNYVFNVDPGWEEYAVFDDFDDFGVTSCEGWVQIAGVTYDATALTVTLTNNLMAPADSIIIGTYNPADFPVLGRTLDVTITFIVKDYDLYVSHFRGLWTDVSALGQGGTGDWGTDYSTVARGDMGWPDQIAGGSYDGVRGVNPECTVLMEDFEILLASQTFIPVDLNGNGAYDDERYKLRIRSNPDYNNVSWRIAPLRLTPNRPVIMQATASFHSVQDTSDPVQFILQNDNQDYDLPDLRQS